jgi:CxxC-x17-CxxC domain-containing protein
MDQTIDCVQCSAPFTFTAAEQEFFASRNLQTPRRCKSCRTARRRDGTGKPGGPREYHDAVCAQCMTACKVPFKPTEGRPVFCRDCFKGQEQAA